MLALVASSLLVLVPFGHDLGHVLGGHVDAAHGPDLGVLATGALGHHSGEGFAAGQSHGECEAWSARTEAHQRHSDAQFETAEKSRHQAHGVCPGPASSSIVARTTSTGDGLAPTVSLAIEPLSAPIATQTAQPPSRGPPTPVDAATST